MDFEISRHHAHGRICELIKRAELDREIRQAKLERTIKLSRFLPWFPRFDRRHA